MKLLSLLKCGVSLLENSVPVTVLLILGSQITVRDLFIYLLVYFAFYENALVSILAAKNCWSVEN